MLDVKDGNEALKSWQGEGEYILSESPSVYDGWHDSRVWCESLAALEDALREYYSVYHMLPCVLKVVGLAW